MSNIEIVKYITQILINGNFDEELVDNINKLKTIMNVKTQPTLDQIIRTLKEYIYVSECEEIAIGDILSANKIGETLGRVPQQEGINFCKNTTELFVITKIGRDNPCLETSEYNDYWEQGKIYYEGKGQDEQIIKSSNLHLYRKYQVFNKDIKVNGRTKEYIHVFNKVKKEGSEKYQYLGKFMVTNWKYNNTSIKSGSIDETKNAIIFELTPICGKLSKDIDPNYIMDYFKENILK